MKSERSTGRKNTWTDQSFGNWLPRGYAMLRLAFPCNQFGKQEKARSIFASHRCLRTSNCFVWANAVYPSLELQVSIASAIFCLWSWTRLCRGAVNRLATSLQAWRLGVATLTCVTQPQLARLVTWKANWQIQTFPSSRSATWMVNTHTLCGISAGSFGTNKISSASLSSARTLQEMQHETDLHALVQVLWTGTTPNRREIEHKCRWFLGTS